VEDLIWDFLCENNGDNMSIFDMFKKKEIIKLDRPVQGPSNVQAINHHKIRIENLSDELDILESKIKLIQQSEEKLNSVKNKELDNTIFRMAIIKYEIDIRGDHLKWLYS